MSAPRDSPAVHWCATWNNPPQDELGDTPITGMAMVRYTTYYVQGEEIAPTTGTPHLQIYFHLRLKQRLSQVKRLFPEDCGIHLEKMKAPTAKQAADYCKKDGKFVEFGLLPRNASESKSENHRQVILLAKSGDLNQIADEYPTEYLIYNRTLEHISRNSRVASVALTPTSYPGIWIYGAPGVGKSRHARELAPTAFHKMTNKWWCGYSGEDDVIIDDVDAKSMECMIRYFKLWLDIYPFPAEIKGGSLGLIRPKRIILTSNYSIKECCVNDVDAAALTRRCDVTHMVDLMHPSQEIL